MRIAALTLVTILALSGSLGPALAQSAGLTATEQKEGWKPLFDGQTTNGWTPRPPPAGRGATEAPQTAKWAVENGEVEINIFDDTEQFPTGSIDNVQRTSAAKPNTVGKWNALEISRQVDHVAVVLNGEKVVDIRTTLHPGGHIALQAPAEGTAKFRNARIQTL